ncbi:MAG: sigma-54 dependent transcriptional regulator [Ignavibacteria bacterium]|nr:sigma-54 dependent transcriptional regulator [Ignavibacteria bacterium]
MAKILVVDDDISIVESFNMVLPKTEFEIDTSNDGPDALRKIKQKNYDLIFLDIKMPKMDGIEVLEKIMEYNNDLIVIMISGHATIETAVESTKKGAYDFLEKPFGLDELDIKIKNALKYKRSKDELKKLKEEVLKSYEIVGVSEKINKVRELISKYSNLDFNILITGESGTGKMLVARQIHITSSRSEYPFITINCAVLNEENLETELFGKYQNNNLITKGKLLEAEEGSILFDEISCLSLEVQSKLLKVIDERKFSATGLSGEINLKSRLLFSTNQDLESLIEENNFRHDLYHRINVLNINIPPLRERVEDIPVLADYFIKQISLLYNVREKRLTENAKEKLMGFRFPGNVRELKNLIERIIFTVEKNVIDADDILIPDTRHTIYFSELFNKNLTLNDFQNESEKLFIQKVLNDYKYNIKQTADALKIQRSHLYKLMNKYKIPLPSRKTGDN